MTDDLRPDLKDALKKLPRERVPAGLEARVTDAMRDHGFLSRRRRVVAVTGSRMAGLLAASIALMIGAYSIGLHRGGGDAVLPTTIPAPRRDLGNATVNEPPPPAVKAKDSQSIADKEAKGDVAEPAPPPVLKKERAMTAADEGRYRDADDGAAMSDRVEAPASAEEATPARRQLMTRSQSPSPPSPSSEPAETASAPPPVFMLGGIPLAIDAPDSVRITQDERGQMILIYTADGIIRIRPARGN